MGQSAGRVRAAPPCPRRLWRKLTSWFSVREEGNIDSQLQSLVIMSSSGAHPGPTQSASKKSSLGDFCLHRTDPKPRFT
uniref:Uncharacterized protein n=1 Tax=Knipowitschia caucasica TaxID=637954 RepID=A0AAV2K266_KNICA